MATTNVGAVKKPRTTSPPWSGEEDDKLRRAVARYGLDAWGVIAGHFPARQQKSVRERWYNVLDPTLKKEPWSEAEDNILWRRHVSGART
jgi:hypothetical protein